MNIEELIVKNYTKLNETDLHIWEQISKHDILNLSIEALSKECNVSRTTILRFARKIGLDGYSELKFYIKNSHHYPQDSDVKILNLNSLYDNYIKLIDDMRKRDFSHACKLLSKSDNIFIVCSGYIQKGAAREMKRLFYSINKFVHIIEGESEKKLLLNGIKSDDLVIIISNSGSSDEIYNTALQLKVKNIPIISITQLETSRISTISDENIYIIASKFLYGDNQTYYSTTIIYNLVEMLFANYLNYIQTEEE